MRCLWQIFVAASALSLAFYLFPSIFLRECILCICVPARVFVSMIVSTYFELFFMHVRMYVSRLSRHADRISALHFT